MINKRPPVVVMLAIAIAACVGSCEDLGDEVQKSIRASSQSVSLSPGGSASVTISGGTPPYTISLSPDTAVATASLANLSNGNADLFIAAAMTVVTARTTEVRVEDSDSHDGVLSGPTNRKNEITITISVSPTPAVSFSGQIQPILTNNCSSRGCHPGGGAPFPLGAGQSYGNLVNVAATVGPCAGQMRVNPGSAGTSVLYLRLMGTTCGNQMPLGGFNPLQLNELNLIRDWINEGARNN